MVTEYGYRSENFGGSGVRDLSEIRYFEMCELGNVDILMYVLQEGILDNYPELKEITEDAIRLNEESSVLDADSTSEWMEYCDKLVQTISKYAGQDIKYGLWLTDEESCKKFYAKNAPHSIECYKTGEIVLSDLGPGGKLYGYKELPKAIENYISAEKIIKKDNLER